MWNQTQVCSTNIVLTLCDSIHLVRLQKAIVFIWSISSIYSWMGEIQATSCLVIGHPPGNEHSYEYPGKMHRK